MTSRGVSGRGVSGIRDTYYDATQVPFDQTTCGICWGDFQAQDPIVELACKHIWHQKCFSDVFIRCPVCMCEIAGRNRAYSREEVHEKVDELFRNVLQLVPGVQNVESATLDSIVDYIQDQDNRQVIRSYDLVAMLQQLNDFLQAIVNGDEEQIEAFSNPHTFMIIEEARAYARNHLADINEERFPEDIPEIISIIKIILGLFGVDQRIINYISQVTEKGLRDQRIVDIFARRRQKYIRLIQQYLRPPGFWGRLRHNL